MILTTSKKGLSILCEFEAFFVMRCVGHGRSGTREKWNTQVTWDTGEVDTYGTHMGSKMNDYILMHKNKILVIVLNTHLRSPSVTECFTSLNVNKRTR